LARAALGGERTEGPVLRVVTYNVLSPTLCQDRRFPHCKPEDLQEGVRWERILLQLEAAIAEDHPTVICLQEVDELWAGKLHSLFQRRGWHFAYAPAAIGYFKPFGVAMAWPNDAFELDKMSIIKIGAEFNYPKLDLPTPPTTRERVLAALSLGLLGRWSASKEELEHARLEKLYLPWIKAARRQNRLLCARLRFRGSNQSLAVATYHTPCLFQDPEERQSKAIHMAIMRERTAHFARGLEYVLAGDLNSKPQDSELALVLGDGEVADDDVARPPSINGLSIDTWRAAKGTGSRRLRSAYADRLGREPEFTNYAWIEDQPEPFKGTLDYVLVSPGLEVLAVRELPAFERGALVFPNAAQPSDHLLLSADLRLSLPPSDDAGGKQADAASGAGRRK